MTMKDSRILYLFVMSGRSEKSEDRQYKILKKRRKKDNDNNHDIVKMADGCTDIFDRL